MTRRIGGANRPSTSVVTKMSPPNTWTLHGIDGPIRALVEVDFEGHGIGKFLVPLVVRRQAAKEMPTNLQRLKDRLESRTA